MTINAVEVNFENNQLLAIDSFGMRPMQRRAYEHRQEKYLLIKSPPASGKSRALMYIALDKLHFQGVKKVIIAVPERAIGGSFQNTNLTSGGYHFDWNIEPKWNLCTPGSESGAAAHGKVKALSSFLQSADEALVCTHATLRFAFQDLGAAAFDDVLIAIDEFHHASSSEENRLGEMIRSLIDRGNCHIVAMTGSYFRGDEESVMGPEDEARFKQISYTYYEQMSAYEHLKCLKIGYHFYTEQYLSALPEILDTKLKTIIHIPNVNSAESTGDKYSETDSILDLIGDYDGVDTETGFIRLRAKDGRLLNIANLVDDDEEIRSFVLTSLRDPQKLAVVDIIIALGMAKEGFDAPAMQHAITIGYRSSLTEIIQIIGRVTRDYPNKKEAFFTHLIANPTVDREVAITAVNTMLKAISVSLAMEQALAPKSKFYAKNNDNEPTVQIDENSGVVQIGIKGLKEPENERVKAIIEQQMLELIAAACQDKRITRAMIDDSIAPEVVNEVYVAKVIEEKFPDLTPDEIETVRQHLAAQMVIASIAGKPDNIDNGAYNAENKEFGGNKNFVNQVRRFVNVNDLNVDLIDSINPFQNAYEVISKGLNSNVLQAVHEVVKAQGSITMTEEEAVSLWPRINRFAQEHGRKPSMDSVNPLEKRLGEALLWLKNKKRQQLSQVN